MSKINDPHFHRLARCPHCSVANPLFTNHYHTPEPIIDAEGAFGKRHGLFTCTTCAEAILVSSRQVSAKLFKHNDSPEFFEIKVVVPHAPAVDEDLPESAKNYLQQAIDTQNSPDASIVVAASAVDAMLRAKGLTIGSLYTRIDAAEKNNIITGSMAQWAHAVRLEANNVRHVDDENPHATREQAQQVIQFAQALGTFLFTLQAKIDVGLETATAS